MRAAATYADFVDFLCVKSMNKCKRNHTKNGKMYKRKPFIAVKRDAATAENYVWVV